MPSNTIWLASVMTLARVVASQNVLFFYTDTVDLCQYNGVAIEADNQTTHGGVCAYRNDVGSVYACPAPDANCWTWSQECTSSGIGQTVCNRGGTVFCCNAVAGDSCTTTQDQIDICISNFSSPNAGVSVSKANSVYLAAIGQSTVTATTQTAKPSPFTTEQLGVAVSTSSSSTARSSTTIRSSSSSSTGSAAAQSTSSNAVAASSNSSSSGISGGAIAGIVIGVIALLAIAGVIAFFVLKKKRSTGQSRTQSQPLTSEMESHSPPTGAYAGNEKKKYNDFYPPGSATSELGSEGHGRVEMPVNGHDAHQATRYEMA